MSLGLGAQIHLVDVFTIASPESLCDLSVQMPVCLCLLLTSGSGPSEVPVVCPGAPELCTLCLLGQDSQARGSGVKGFGWALRRGLTTYLEKSNLDSDHSSMDKPGNLGQVFLSEPPLPRLESGDNNADPSKL